MCGIFGFALAKPVPLTEVFRVLERLEVHQYPSEETPVGGYGAGIAILGNGELSVTKIGKTGSTTPVRELVKLAKTAEASVLISHVRMPSPQFMQTAYLRETAQPYTATCYSGSAIASTHNGYIENYQHLRIKLGRDHFFESEKTELIDSEVIPHCFEEALKANADVEEALHTLQATLEGSRTLALLQTGQKGDFLHLVHKGKTRGLTVWTNARNEIVFISRKETLTEGFGKILTEGKFMEKASIQHREEKSLVMAFRLH